MSGWESARGVEMVERIRMAVSDIGLDPSGIRADTSWDARTIPAEAAWRAREVAKMADPWCRACFDSIADLDHHAAAASRQRCQATRPLLADCGVSS